jgi:uncharacterized membrane protein YphA (DoxX/SURF4 family)
MRKTYHVIEVCCRWLLGLVFLYGGIPKLFKISNFAETVGAYGIVPDDFLQPVALGIAVLEVVAGVGLLARKRLAQHLTAVMLIMFISVLFYGIWLGLDIDCGCFAGYENEHGGLSSLKEALIRDLFLLPPLFFIYCQPLINNIISKEYNVEKT